MAWVNLLDIVYPVGSLYFTNNATSPAAIVGGSWTKIEEAAIRSGDTIGYIGEDEHAITVDEMPSHRHGIHGGWGAGKLGSSWWRTDSNNPKNIWEEVESTGGGGQAMSLVQRSYNCFIYYRTA